VFFRKQKSRKNTELPTGKLAFPAGKIEIKTRLKLVEGYFLLCFFWTFSAALRTTVTITAKINAINTTAY
jgi:hypothetical protein